MFLRTMHQTLEVIQFSSQSSQHYRPAFEKLHIFSGSLPCFCAASISSSCIYSGYRRVTLTQSEVRLLEVVLPEHADDQGTLNGANALYTMRKAAFIFNSTRP